MTLGERGSGSSKAVVVMMVATGSEAEAAGIEPGDEVLSVNGHDVHTLEGARQWLTGPLGEDVVVVLRGDDDLNESSVRVKRERVRR